MKRHYTLIDKLLMQVDSGFNTVLARQFSSRPNPSKDIDEKELSKAQQRDSQGYMRVNHTGEVCAQALYRGQLLLARNDQTKQMLKQGAIEETDHLAWTHQRLQELNTHRSYLNIFWYVNAFAMGLFAAAVGDKWSLGFIEETERQVSEHLTGHLGKLPADDIKSRQVVKQMREDEEHHGAAANKAGAVALPGFVKWAMRCQAKVMTTLVYWI